MARVHKLCSEYVVSANFVGGVGVTQARLIKPIFIGHVKQYAVTVQTSGSHGLGISIYTSPFENNSATWISQTGDLTTLTSGIHGAVTLNVINNNQNWLSIEASATAVNSASMIYVNVQAIED